MTRVLEVYLNTQQIGQLKQDLEGRLTFQYNESWLHSPAAQPISQSLPLQKEVFNSKQCRNFFAGLLPEGHIRELISKNLHISPRNDYALLAKIGGDCAGALTFLPLHQTPSSVHYAYELLSENALANILQSLPKQPLLTGIKKVRLSLAGAQDKIALAKFEQQYFLPLHGAPSNYLLKPANPDFAGILENEAFCLQLARAIGLPAAKVTITNANAQRFLVIARYDRVTIKKNIQARLHQEDFCQALNIAPELKYQNEGGPSLKQCFALLQSRSSVPLVDTRNLLDGVIFNFLIGNHDAHGKNFSLLYTSSGTQLAPFYDLISTAIYPELPARMAMKIGNTYEHKMANTHQWEKFAVECGLSASLVIQRQKEIAKRLWTEAEKLAQNNFPNNPTIAKILAYLRKGCEKLTQNSL